MLRASELAIYISPGHMRDPADGIISIKINAALTAADGAFIVTPLALRAQASFC